LVFVTTTTTTDIQIEGVIREILDKSVIDLFNLLTLSQVEVAPSKTSLQLIRRQRDTISVIKIERVILEILDHGIDGASFLRLVQVQVGR